MPGETKDVAFAFEDLFLLQPLNDYAKQTWTDAVGQLRAQLFHVHSRGSAPRSRLIFSVTDCSSAPRRTRCPGRLKTLPSRLRIFSFSSPSMTTLNRLGPMP